MKFKQLEVPEYMSLAEKLSNLGLPEGIIMISLYGPQSNWGLGVEPRKRYEGRLYWNCELMIKVGDDGKHYFFNEGEFLIGLNPSNQKDREMGEIFFREKGLWDLDR